MLRPSISQYAQTYVRLNLKAGHTALIAANDSLNNNNLSPKNDHNGAPFLPLFGSMVEIVTSGRRNLSQNALVHTDVIGAHQDAL